MIKRKTLTTAITPESYNKVHLFLNKYNEKTGEDLTISKLVWKAVKKFANDTAKEWKKTPQDPM